MAVNYASKTSYTGNFGLSAGTTMALPSGTTAGELLILVYTYAGSSSSDGTLGFDSNAGELPILGGEIEFADAGYTGSFFAGARYFFPNSTDISNGTINMHSNNSYGYVGYVELYRISGTTNSALVTSSYNVVTGTSPSFDNDVTPIADTGILLLLACSANNSTSITASGYAVTTDNPSWTEITDKNQDDGGGQKSGIHTAYSSTRTSTNTTGNSTINFTSGGSTTTWAILVSVSNPTNVTTVIDTAGILTLSGNEPSFILDNVITIDTAGILTLSQPEPTINVEENPLWTPDTKNSSTIWVEDTK